MSDIQKEKNTQKSDVVSWTIHAASSSKTPHRFCLLRTLETI